MSYPELGPLSSSASEKSCWNLEGSTLYTVTMFRRKWEQSSGWLRDGLVLTALKETLWVGLIFLFIKVFEIIT